MSKRKGARTVKDVDAEILKELNLGLIETANLMEGLAMDLNILAKNVGIKCLPTTETSIVKKMQYFGSQISNYKFYKEHTSDTVRGFAVFALAKSDLSFKTKLKEVLHFADDKHFGVREWAWLAMREEIIQNLKPSITFFEKHSTHKSANIRRFCSEATRPRGVWCAHIGELKENPEICLTILENLKSDPEKYVKDSVGNWLNDAAKSKPTFVKKLCSDWKKLKNSDTDYIIKKALRSL
jgi:3-methyladenine DNA glycosylase AlkC